MQGENAQYVIGKSLSSESDFVKKADEGAVIALLKADILACITQSTCDLTILKELNDFVSAYDGLASQIIFQELADLHIHCNEAVTVWWEIHQHSLWLNK